MLHYIIKRLGIDREGEGNTFLQKSVFNRRCRVNIPDNFSRHKTDVRISNLTMLIHSAILSFQITVTLALFPSIFLAVNIYTAYCIKAVSLS